MASIKKSPGICRAANCLVPRCADGFVYNPDEPSRSIPANPLYCHNHQRITLPGEPVRLSKRTWDDLWPLVRLKIRDHHRSSRWLFAELENSIRSGYGAVNIFAVLQHASTLGLVTRNSENGEYVFMLTTKGQDEKNWNHPFTLPGEPPVPQTPPSVRPTLALWAHIHVVLHGRNEPLTARNIHDRLHYTLRRSEDQVFDCLLTAEKEGLVIKICGATEDEDRFRLTALGEAWKPTPIVITAGEPPVPQTPPQPPAAPAPSTADLLGTVLTKLEAAIAVNDSLTAKIAKIEEMLKPPPALKGPLTAEAHALTREYLAKCQKTTLGLVMTPDDRVTLPLDIDADLLARLEKHLATWASGKSVNAVIVDLIEDYLP